MVPRLPLLLLLATAAWAAEPAPAGPDLAANHRERGELRERICLNGFWEGQPVAAPAAQPPEDGWAVVAVPSAWTMSDCFPFHRSARFRPGKWAGDDRWDGKPLKEFPAAWYRRAFILPAGWDAAGARVLLRCERFTRGGTVLLNGAVLGSQDEWDDPARGFALSGKLRTGANALAIRVDAAAAGEVVLRLGAEQTRTVKAEAKLRGITGDVWLVREPTGPRLASLALQPSVRRGELAAEVEVEGLGDPAGLAVEVVVRDQAGNEARRLPAAALGAPDAGRARVRLAAPWPDAIRWDVDHPHLYRAEARLLRAGAAIDATLPESFGFREVWCEGRELLLNGTPLHFTAFAMGAGDGFAGQTTRAARAEAERMLALHRRAGFNAILLGPEGIGQRGLAAQRYDDVLDLANRAGMVALVPLVPPYDVDWASEAGRATWRTVVAATVARYRNRPSVIAWSMNFNLLGYPWDMHPAAWGSDYLPGDALLDLGRKRRQAAESEAVVRALDPTRVVYHHAGGNHGQWLTSNYYPSWPPLQEREDAPSAWSVHGRKPLVFVELGNLVPMDWLRGRIGDYNDVRWTEPLEAEYAAPYLGGRAYDLQEDAYLRLVVEGARPGQQAGADKYEVNQSYFWGYAQRQHEPVASVERLVVPAMLRAWRGYGVTGTVPHHVWLPLVGAGYEPWMGAKARYEHPDPTLPGPKPAVSAWPREAERLTAVGEAWAAALRPLQVWIGGSATAGFTAKDHAFAAGEVVDKQVVAVNDSRRERTLALRWILRRPGAGAALASGELRAAVAPGARSFVPFRVAMPAVAERTPLRLDLEPLAPLGDDASCEGLDLTVFPPLPAPAKPARRVLAIDPGGATTRALAAQGVTARPSSDGAEALPGDLVVLGSGALEGGAVLSPALAVAVRGGAVLVCLAQRDLARFGLRTHARAERRAFIAMPGHPLFAGLEDRDFADWNGATGLRAASTPLGGGDDRYPEEIWAWGNRGALMAEMIEKPSGGGFRPLLECGFDLAYAAVLEAGDGAGTVLFCQLDLDRRSAADPVAGRVLRNLLAHALALAPRRPQAVAGGGPLAALLGVQPAAGAPAIELCTAAPDAAGRARLAAFAAEGGTVIAVGAGVGDGSWLPVPVQVGRGAGYRLRPTAPAPLLAGAGPADWFLKLDLAQHPAVRPGAGVRLLCEPGVLAEVAHGRGRFLLCTIDPAALLAAPVSPERHARAAQKLVRLLALAAAGLGADLRGPSARMAEDPASAVALPARWRFRTDPANQGRAQGWAEAGCDEAAWTTLAVPGLWEDQGVTEANPAQPGAKRPYDGTAWYRTTVTVPEALRGKPLVLELGAIDDCDVTYLNGKRIGATGEETPDSYARPRCYPIPPELVRFGAANTVVVKVIDLRGGGGFGGTTAPAIRVDRREGYPYLAARPLFNPYHLKRW